MVQNVVPMTNVLTRLPALGGGVVDYVLVNTFRIGPLSPVLDHKPLYLHIANKKSQNDQSIIVQKEKM